MLLINVPAKLGKWSAMSIYPFVLVKKRDRGNQRIIRHESIHLAQQREVTILAFFLFLIGFLCFEVSIIWIVAVPVLFYVFYFTEWLIRGILIWDFKPLGKAYMQISFEREAYKNECEEGYLKERKYFSFINYFT